MPAPRIARVNCKKLRFQPGDSILVRCFFPVDAEVQKKYSKIIHKNFGPDVQVFVYDGRVMDITVEQGLLKLTPEVKQFLIP